MIVALWRRRHRRRAAMAIQALGSRTAGIFRYRLIGCDLLGYGALRLAIGQRRHRRTGRAAGHRRLGLFVATTEADMGEALQQGHATLLRVLLLGLTAGLAN